MFVFFLDDQKRLCFLLENWNFMGFLVGFGWGFMDETNGIEVMKPYETNDFDGAKIAINIYIYIYLCLYLYLDLSLSIYLSFYLCIVYTYIYIYMCSYTYIIYIHIYIYILWMYWV